MPDSGTQAEEKPSAELGVESIFVSLPGQRRILTGTYPVLFAHGSNTSFPAVLEKPGADTQLPARGHFADPAGG